MATCEVLDGTPLAYWPINERDILIRCVGRACAESAALAAQGDRVLWDDELGVGQLTRQFGVRRIWTQALFSQLADSGRVTANDYQDLTIALLRYNHRFTRINSQALLYALDKGGWNTTDPAVSTVLEALSDPIASSGSVLGVVVDVLKHVWSSAVNIDKKLAATQALLMAMERRPGGRKVVRLIFINTRMISAETPDYVLHLRWFLKNWLLTGSVTDLTWTIVEHSAWLADEI